MKSNAILASVFLAIFTGQQGSAQVTGQVVVTDNASQSTMGMVTTPEQLIFDESSEVPIWRLQCRYEKIASESSSCGFMAGTPPTPT